MYCSDHPEVETQVRCLDCERWLCVDCLKEVTAGRVELEVCRHCGGLVHDHAPPPEEKIEDLSSFRELLTTHDALGTAVALALPAAISTFPLAYPVILFYLVGLGTYFLAVTDHIARGRLGFPGWDDGPWTSAGFGLQIARGGTLIVVVLAPYLLWHFGVMGIDDESTLGTVVGWILLLLGLGYAPAAVLAMVLSRATLASAWAPAWVQIVRTDPRSYGVLTGQVVGAGLLWLAVETLGGLLLGWLWILGPLVVTTASNLVIFAMAMLIGRWVRQHREDFGLETPASLR